MTSITTTSVSSYRSSCRQTDLFDRYNIWGDFQPFYSGYPVLINVWCHLKTHSLLWKSKYYGISLLWKKTPDYAFNLFPTCFVNSTCIDWSLRLRDIGTVDKLKVFCLALHGDSIPLSLGTSSYMYTFRNGALVGARLLGEWIPKASNIGDNLAKFLQHPTKVTSSSYKKWHRVKKKLPCDIG